MMIAKLLTAEAFAPYGQVLQGSGKAQERLSFAAQMTNGLPDAKPNLTYMRLIPELASHISLTELERHSDSNQAFMPLNGTQHLVVVCPSDAQAMPDLSKLEVFVAAGIQAVNYNATIWHAPRLPLSASGEFIMFRFENGSDKDTEVFKLSASLPIDLSLARAQLSQKG